MRRFPFHCDREAFRMKYPEAGFGVSDILSAPGLRVPFQFSQQPSFVLAFSATADLGRIWSKDIPRDRHPLATALNLLHPGIAVGTTSGFDGNRLYRIAFKLTNVPDNFCAW